MESFPIGNLTPLELRQFIEESYNNKNFSNEKILPIKKLKEKLYLLEEFHGPTASFKDLALEIFSKFFEFSTKKKNKKQIILVATSGDTGSAVLASFNKTQIPVIVLYPKEKIR